MKKWLLLVLAALLIHHFGLWPFPETDAAELSVAKTLTVELTEDRVVLRTEQGEGAGRNLSSALMNLQENMPGQLFLRQVRRVVFCGGAEAAVPPETLPEDLPMGACVYQWQGAEELDLEALDPVLEAREARDPDRLTLAMLEDAHLAGETLPLPDLRWENPDGT